nr:protein FAM13A-like [Lytechinus pictus]
MTKQLSPNWKARPVQRKTGLIDDIRIGDRRSNSESSLEHLVNSFAEKEGISVRNRVQQFSDDTLVSTKSHDRSHPIKRKGRPTSKAFDIFESQGIIIGKKLVDSTISERVPRETSSSSSKVSEDSELDIVKRNSGPLNSLTAGRVAPPKRRSPTKKNRGSGGEDSRDSLAGKEKAANRSDYSDLKTQNQDVWLRQHGDGQNSPPNRNRNPREGGLWGIHNTDGEPQHKDQPVPQPRTRRGKAKEGEKDEGRRKQLTGGSDIKWERRKIEEDERENDGGEARRINERGEDGRRRDEETRDEKMEDELRRLVGEERENPPSSALKGQVVPPLDLTSLHVNTEGPAWQGQQASPRGGGGQSGSEGSTQTLSRLEKLQTITSLLQHEPYDAPLSPRAKDAPPTFGSGSWDMLESPPSPVTKHDLFPRSSKRSESSLEEEDQVSVIKRLTRQVRSLKQKIKQYEEEFERQYHAKPSHTEKLSQPEIRKMIGELKRANKHLKALKIEAKESKNPLHSTLPARLSPNGEEEGSSTIHLAGLKEALNLAQNRLQEKRDDAKRGFDVLEMNQDEVKEEKVAIQKALLQLESKYGRPTAATHQPPAPFFEIAGPFTRTGDFTICTGAADVWVSPSKSASPRMSLVGRCSRLAAFCRSYYRCRALSGLSFSRQPALRAAVGEFTCMGIPINMQVLPTRPLCQASQFDRASLTATALSAVTLSILPPRRACRLESPPGLVDLDTRPPAIAAVVRATPILTPSPLSGMSHYLVALPRL